jgi:hydrogenase nickel incorporation protein HypB
LGDEHPSAVVEGDLATRNDAERIEATGRPVYQIETGTACHLTAHAIEHAVGHLPVAAGSLVLVENVGNLVCPAMFDIGESLRVVCLSVTEGADKPEKYPVAFREADLTVITKADLLPYLDFDLDACLRLIEQIKPGLTTLVTSARDKRGLADLADHLMKMWHR